MVVAPSVPPDSVKLAAVGALVLAPAAAVMICDGPRVTLVPLLIAAAIATHSALPDRPAPMLSNTSGLSVGAATVTFQVLAALPAASATVTVLPSVPVYFAVRVKPFV